MANVDELSAHDLLTENLRRLTQLGGIPLTVVADRAGINRRELFAVMAGEIDPDLDWLCRLAAGVGVPLSTLFLEPEPQRDELHS
ncbi:helix-turn-helix domain-containing protein [Plesiocystis pacifica]|nr:helix-turn-helix transcriptional regulator [Plesiocystis pacifica]